jgi:hypothetical protein
MIPVHRINTIKVLVFLLFVFVLNGCTYYGYKNIQVLTPPEKNTIMQNRKVTILQNSYRTTSDSVKQALVDTIHRYALEGFLFSLADYGNIPFDVDSSLAVRVNKDAKLTIYDWQKLDSVARNRDTDIILLLDASDLSVKSDLFFNDQGYVEAWKDFFIANRWVIIDPREQRVIKDDISIDTLSYTETGFFISATQDKLPETEDVIAELSWETGRIFAEKYIPTWQDRSRLYYHLPNQGYEKAINALLNNDLETAARIFKNYAEHQNDRISALSKYNMAVVCELQGEYDLALQWLRDSYQTKKYNTTQEYIRILKERIEENKSMF